MQTLKKLVEQKLKDIGNFRIYFNTNKVEVSFIFNENLFKEDKNLLIMKYNDKMFNREETFVSINNFTVNDEYENKHIDFEKNHDKCKNYKNIKNRIFSSSGDNAKFWNKVKSVVIDHAERWNDNIKKTYNINFKINKCLPPFFIGVINKRMSPKRRKQLSINYHLPISYINNIGKKITFRMDYETNNFERHNQLKGFLLRKETQNLLKK